MKALLRRCVPPRWRPRLRHVYWWGRGPRCPVCRCRVRRYLPEGFDVPVLRELDVVGGEHWPARTCPVCFVNTRARLVWFYLCRESAVLASPARLLHVAPEPGIYWRLSALPGVDYHPADLEPDDYGFADDVARADLTALPHADASFDVVLANHVLEHVEDEERALAEIRRVLRPGGWAMLQVPLARALEHTLEDPAVKTPEERLRRYGQADHVRLYGRDYAQRLTRAGFQVELYGGHVQAAPAHWLLNPRERLPIARRPG